jgi:hypothetical protein
LSGSFDLILNDGNAEMKVSLNRSYNGVLVPRMIWRQMENFSTNALVLIAADQVFDESDYIRDFDTFKKLKQS